MTAGARLGLIGSALAVVAVWLLHPVGVPLYDGIGFPDEPYRYVSPPPDAKPAKGPVTTASDTSPVSGGTNKQLFFATSAEQGPQVTVSMPSQSLSDPTATKLTLRAAPVAPSAQPQGALIDGNVYRVTWFGDSGSITPTRNESLAYVVMRATSGRQPGPTMYYRTSATTSWQAIRTTRVGTDIYQSPLPGQGDFALAFSSTGGGGGGFPVALVVVIVIVLALAVGVILLVRLRRRGET